MADPKDRASSFAEWQTLESYLGRPVTIKYIRYHHSRWSSEISGRIDKECAGYLRKVAPQYVTIENQRLWFLRTYDSQGDADWTQAEEILEITANDMAIYRATQGPDLWHSTLPIIEDRED